MLEPHFFFYNLSKNPLKHRKNSKWDEMWNCMYLWEQAELRWFALLKLHISNQWQVEHVPYGEIAEDGSVISVCVNYICFHHVHHLNFIMIILLFIYLVSYAILKNISLEWWWFALWWEETEQRPGGIFWQTFPRTFARRSGEETSKSWTQTVRYR